MLTILSDPTNALRILWCLRSLSVEIRKIQPYASTVETPTSQHHGRTPISQHHGRTPTSQHHGRIPTSQYHGRTSTKSFSKSSKFSAHLFRAWRHPHSSRISCRGFIMTVVIVISFAHERKLHQLTTHLNS